MNNYTDFNKDITITEEFVLYNTYTFIAIASYGLFLLVNNYNFLKNTADFYKQYNISLMTKYELVLDEKELLDRDNILLDKMNRFYKSEIHKLSSEIEDFKKELEIKRTDVVVEQSESQIFNENTNSVIKINSDIITNYGNGPIRYMSNENKYYHGVGLEDKKSWNVDNRYNRVIFEYNDRKRKLAAPDRFDTFNAFNFCKNCVYDEDFSKSRKILKIYKCLGH